MTRFASDPRLDPRFRTRLDWPTGSPRGDVDSRETLLKEAQSPAALAIEAARERMFSACNSEYNAPSAGLVTREEAFTSFPDGNLIRVSITRPDTTAPLPCIYYLHGGGMQAMSCFNGMYQAWARIIAAQGVAVVMPDFRNAVRPSSSGKVAPFPAGLNDCVAGVRWTVANAARLGLDPGRMVVAGESGGDNLALATGMKLSRDGEGGLIAGLYAFCPYIAGRWPHPGSRSSVEEEGLLLYLHNNRGAMAYGVEAFARRDPLAWPAFASRSDVRGLPPTVISVHECDPLRDEGVNFYRLLLSAGVAARCRQTMGTLHATEIFSIVCPEISRDAAADLARFATQSGGPRPEDRQYRASGQVGGGQ